MKAEDQPFQDLLFHAIADCLEISIVPHINIHLSIEDVVLLMGMMKEVSAPDTEEYEQFSKEGEPPLSVLYMKDSSEICIGGFVVINGLLDSQWKAIYLVFKKYKKWVDKYKPDFPDVEFYQQVSPNRETYDLFSGELPKEELDQKIRKNWEDIFDRTGVKL